MSNTLRDRFAINKTGSIRDHAQAALHAMSRSESEVGHETFPDHPKLPELEIDLGIPINRIDLSTAFEKIKEGETRDDFEHIPRETFLKMLIQKPELEVEFSFKVQRKQGNHYIQAIRQVISRTRRKARNEKRRLQEFKLIVKSVETMDDHDVVTLIRAKTMNAVQRSVYDKLLDAFEQPRAEK